MGRSKLMRRPWPRFLASRLARLLCVLSALVLLTFLMVQLVPGDPARAIAGPQADQAAVERVRREAGLDRPLPERLGDYAAGLVHGDLGVSNATREPVREVIADRIGPTAQLVGLGMLIVAVVGIAVGVAAGIASGGGGRWREIAFSVGTGALAAVPHYLMATFLVFVFAVTLSVFPVAGAGSLWAAVLPAVAIALRPTVLVARMVRVRTLEVLEQPYMRAAASKRLARRRLYARHAFPNVVTAALALGGVIFATLIGASVVVEQVFARPGLGTTLVDAVLSGDYPVVQGVVLVLGVSVVVVNALTDVLVRIVDPRVAEEGR